MSCCEGSGCGELEKIFPLIDVFKALHCPARWNIIRIIGEGERSTGEIYQELQEAGESLAKSSLYYHISELDKAGIVELAGYREEGGGAPEKV